MDYYRHEQMKDGHLNKCKECAKIDAKIGNVPRNCLECGNAFMAISTEIKRGGGKICSRKCYYQYLPKMLDKKWSGNRQYHGLHKWVQRKLGKPSKCVFCGTEKGKFEWSNISGKYLEELGGWQRLCIKCHRNYDKAGTKAWITRRKRMATI